MKSICSVILVLLLSSVLYAQNELPKIESSDFPAIKINFTENYNGNSLWGYIDGGADIYLEYGFAKLIAQEIVLETKKYKVDVYKMNNAEDAFGIFSVSKFKCSGKSISKYCCITEYQAMAAKGSYYISVINEKGTAEEQKFTQSIAEKILSQIKEDDYTVPKPFGSEPLVRNVKFINGILGVQNSIPEMEGLFTDLKNFKLHISTAEEGESYTTVAFVTFSNPSDAEAFYSRRSKRESELSKDVKLQMKKSTDNMVIYFETNKPTENKLFSILE